MKRKFAILLLLTAFYSLCGAQGFGYEEISYIGNGLYKVRSGSNYGIMDKDDKVVVSIEFQDIQFREGKALLVKNELLYGVIDTLGTITSFETHYKVHPKFRYVYENVIIVGKTKGPDKWGYINDDGSPLRVNSKSNSIGGKKEPVFFDNVFPFVEGYAAVYSRKRGWQHIDKQGLEHFVLNDKDETAIFRSSVYNGECIIVTYQGIKQYQENSSSQAVVKRVLSPSVTITDPINLFQDAIVKPSLKSSANTDIDSVSLLFREGVLTLDSLMRASKFETPEDRIVFIEKPRKVFVKKVEKPENEEQLTLKEQLMVDIVSNILQADENGKAHSEIEISNISDDYLEGVHVDLECADEKREWHGSIDGNTNVRISFNIPARFSYPSIKRNINITIKHNDTCMELEYPVTIKRYTPVRSR